MYMATVSMDLVIALFPAASGGYIIVQLLYIANEIYKYSVIVYAFLFRLILIIVL